MEHNSTYDLAVAGGGLAGLALAIQVARAGYKVVLFEKEKYPFHRVCGEYISNESRSFLTSLGVELAALNVSNITTLQVSGANGNFFEQELPLGGFGISRYVLDHRLSQLAYKNGVTLFEQTKVNEITFADDRFSIFTTKGKFSAKLAAGTFGKRSNLDIKWRRSFLTANKNKLNNYIGVKYHIKSDFPGHLIALHHFENGYCGISRIEDDKYCFCYLTTAGNLQKSRNDIGTMEQNILSANPHIKKILAESEKLMSEPVTISQISFDKKTLIEDHALMIGDAAGMITPLCGNGMSMALHGSKVAAIEMITFLTNKISRKQMERRYEQHWNSLFAKRLRAGRILQQLMLNSKLVGLTISIGKRLPPIMNRMIRATHGKSF